MTIEIVDAYLDEFPPIIGGPLIWICSLEITQAATTYTLPANAPGTLDQAELQAYFNAKEPELWTLAEERGIEPDVWSDVSIKRVAKAFAEVARTEFNILRGLHGLSDRTKAQMIAAIKDELRN